MLYGGYGGRILEWGLNVVISILVLISNIFMLSYAVIPVCFSPQNDVIEKVNSLILMDNMNYLWIVIFQIGFLFYFFIFLV